MKLAFVHLLVNLTLCLATMLGNSDFQAKLDKVKESFRGISEISDTPSQFMPLDEGWAARRSNLDVVSTSQSPFMPYKLILHLCHMSKMMRRDSNDVDLYKWFVETADQQGWPKIDKARVDKASTTEFREGLTHPTVPIDGEDSGKYRTARGQKLP
ncbi:uncharacterized protein VDAG_08708 [Verticillium dahliae VdLs.17]|uniref:Uncharacterized protein n=1 Tax=Verticillium dahliae (strain VdLs.17 / ATCC MYA-4575 / FGSC 10137) TaxID=498257 RepID=G2XEX6_VERDV|nr:uncharacterized protein VDAG_08708 [Verticillium dahliae VdLs.17]EGY18374.1 hypothetical protein VDAG_08708 [Verticillium dahliae VdLs.17]